MVAVGLCAFALGASFSLFKKHYHPEYFDAGLLAARDNALEQMRSIDDERRLREIKELLGGKRNDRSWEWAWTTLSNSLAMRIDRSVKLEGNAAELWPEGMKVDNREAGTWPVSQGGELRQVGTFVVRNSKGLKPADRISGTGVNPHVVVFTNKLGEVRMVWGYDLKPTR